MHAKNDSVREPASGDGAKTVLDNALQLLERGDSQRALQLLAKELKRNRPRDGALELFLSVADAQTGFGNAAEILETLLTDEPSDMTASTRVSLLEALLLRLEFPLEERRNQLAKAIEAALIDDGFDWSTFSREPLESLVHECLLPPGEGFSLATSMLFAPESLGWRSLSVQTIVLAASEKSATPALRRDAERLLHAAGEPNQAYAIEDLRKLVVQRAGINSPNSSIEQVPAFAGRTFALAGGHAAFRSMVRGAVVDEGGGLSVIPPDFESVRRERDIVGALNSADVVVILTSQISHSTSKQVTRMAHKIGVPVLYAMSASVSGILRLASEWYATDAESSNSPPER